MRRTKPAKPKPSLAELGNIVRACDAIIANENASYQAHQSAKSKRYRTIRAINAVRNEEAAERASINAAKREWARMLKHYPGQVETRGA